MDLYGIKNLLNKGFSYTLIKFDEKGRFYPIHFILESVNIKKSDTSYLLLVVKGHKETLKWDKFIRLEKDEQFILWTGTVKPLASPVWSRGVLHGSYGPITVERRLTWKDGRYLIRAKESVSNLPLMENIHTLGPEVMHNYSCISERQY